MKTHLGIRRRGVQVNYGGMCHTDSPVSPLSYHTYDVTCGNCKRTRIYKFLIRYKAIDEMITGARTG